MRIDKRYSTDKEFCGYESAMYVPRFCGERLRDSTLWPDTVGNQSPVFKTKREAIAACRAYESERQRLIRDFEKQQAVANFYEGRA